MQYTLPWPPSVNSYYRHVNGRAIISRSGRLYRQAVALAVGAVQRPLEGELELLVDLYPPDRRRRDIDNTQKAIWDALQRAGVYRDDYQIRAASIVRREPCPGGKVVVQVMEADQ